MLQIAPSDSPRIHFRSRLFFFYLRRCNYVPPLWPSGEAKSVYDKAGRHTEDFTTVTAERQTDKQQVTDCWMVTERWRENSK